MVTSIGSKMAEAMKAFADPAKVYGFEVEYGKVANGLEKHGFLREVAGDELFNKVVEAVQKSCKEYRGILFTGGNGIGKTMAMKAIYMAFKSPNTWWIDCNDPNSLYAIHDPFLNRQNVFVDDFGGERMLYGDQDVIGAFVVGWYLRHNPAYRLFMTSNLDSEKLNERYGGRVLDRINDLCIICKMEGETRREVETV